MTNLLILYPDIPGNTVALKSYTDDTAEDPNESDFMPFINTFRGERYQYWKSSYTASEHNGVYDVGTGNTKSSNFVVLSRLDFARASATTIDFKLQSSSDDSSYTDRATITDIDTATLKGPWANDYVSTFTATSAFRYWRAKFVKTSGSDFQLKIGKIYFGTALDLERDPAFQIQRKLSGEVSFITSGGVEYPGRVKHPTYEISLRWEGVTDANAESFNSKITKKRHTTPIFLYTTSFHDPLDGKELIHVKCVEVFQEQKFVNWNVIEARFVEVHG